MPAAPRGLKYPLSTASGGRAEHGLLALALAFTYFDGIAPPLWRGLRNFQNFYIDPSAAVSQVAVAVYLAGVGVPTPAVHRTNWPLLMAAVLVFLTAQRYLLNEGWQKDQQKVVGDFHVGPMCLTCIRKLHRLATRHRIAA